uniref:DUF504 domain-containing protein n=1 Tax=Steinernema glaseri TaxID=37863 RepID=A0A1I8AAW6_9BILA
MDPRTLKHSKVFSELQCSPEGLGITGMVAEESLPEKVRNMVGRHRHITSLHRIDHPVDPSSKIYVVYFDSERNVFHETVLVFD